jgi:hypothetical protein
MKHIYACALIVLVMNLPAAAEETSAEQQAVADGSQVTQFPPWPETQASPIPEDDFVPPPPGPYMSNALSAVANGFDGGSAPQLTPNDSGFFKPDMPWPERRFAPNPERWMPKDGYHYAPPDAAVKSPLARHRAQPYGYPGGAPQYMQPPYGWGPAQPWNDGRYAPPPGSGY